MDDVIRLIGVRLEFMSHANPGVREARNINSSLTSYLDPDGFRQLVLAKCGLCGRMSQTLAWEDRAWAASVFFL